MILNDTQIGSAVGGGVRRLAGPSDTLFPSPPITAALRFGTPQRRTFLGDLIMPGFPRTTWKVLVITHGDEHLIVHDTERGHQEPRKRGKFIDSTSTFEMARFGFEHGLDTGLVRDVAEPAFNLVVGAARRSRDAVRLDLENRKALLLSTPGNWPAAHRSDESGSRWNDTGGDMVSAILTGIEQIQSVHPGYQLEDFNLALSHAAWEAARQDAALVAARSGTALAGIAIQPADIERAIGLRPGSLSIGDATVNVGGTVQSLWGETAIAWINTASELDTFYGSDVFALNHELGGGAAFAPYFEDRQTTTWYPFELRALPIVHDYTAGFFWYDMKL